jgi:hypothetical protein
MKFLTRKGFLIEEQGMSYLADTDPDRGLGSLQAAACTYRIALGPRAGHKVLSLQTVPTPRAVSTSRASACMPRSAALPMRGRNSEARHRDVACLAPSATPVPLHHPSRHRQRTPDSKPGRTGGAHPEDTLSRWHDPYRHRWNSCSDSLR